MTIKRTQSDLNKLLAKVIEQVESVGLKPSPIDDTLELSNSASALGSCKKEMVGFTISISKYIKNNDEKELMNTLVHEVLHAVPKCFNHGAQWRAAASLMNEKFNYGIERLANDSVANLTPQHQAVLKRYAIKCADRGQEIYRQTQSKVIKHPEMYSCGCGGELTRIR